MAEDVILPGRACGSCTLCCKLLQIDELDKPACEWCTHCDIGKGCTIYDTRPATCGGFYCGYLTLPMVDEKWYPTRSKMIVYPEASGRRISIHVDPARPDAWKAEPFYSEIKAWARHGMTTGIQLVVLVRNRVIAILPDEDVDLGIAGPDDGIEVVEEDDAGRRVLRARLVRA